MKALPQSVVSLEVRMEQLLTQLDRGQAAGISAQGEIEMFHSRTTAESVVTIHGKRYRLRLREEE